MNMTELLLLFQGIYPGLVETGLMDRGWGKELAKQIYKIRTALAPQDVADAVLYALSAPLNVQVC